jgi:hypothetical protein
MTSLQGKNAVVIGGSSGLGKVTVKGLQDDTRSTQPTVKHQYASVDGVIFYREFGPADAPIFLLPHGYPSSSFQYRNFMPALQTAGD